MADELRSENILIKTDQQNILYLDPNSVVEDGVVKQRYIEHEKLVMYVNLEADIVPRSRVFLGGDSNKEKTNIVSLYKGNINFLKPNDAKTFDTGWTELYTETKPGNGKDAFYQSAASQNFGIKSVTIKNTLANVPQVSMTFIDVRGKTLFESPDNSPYKAFFHMPYPMFYLTLKGYYGKAVRHQLVLMKFNARFDSTTGNYEVTCDFLGPTSPLLNDTLVQYALAVPYMYARKGQPVSKEKVQGIIKDKVVVKEVTEKQRFTTKGYETLKQVYAEYKAAGIIPKDFPDITLRDLIERAKKVENLLEAEFFNKVVDVKILDDMNDFEKVLNNFFDTIMGQVRDNSKPATLNSKNYQKLNPMDDKDKFIKNIDDFIKSQIKKLQDNVAFDGTKSIKITTIKVEVTDLPQSKYLYQDATGDYISLETISEYLWKIRASFNVASEDMHKQLSEQINQTLKSEKGLGFSPTIRNVFAVIMAGVDTFLRLMNEVHEKAITVAQQRSPYISDNVLDKGEYVYPFPQIIKLGKDAPNEIVYPGDQSVASKLHAYDYTLWPEVEFVEEYYSASAEINDYLINIEGEIFSLNNILTKNDASNRKYAQVMTWNYDYQEPYGVKTNVNILYELYERAYVSSLYSGLQNPTAIQELASLDAKNLVEAVKGITKLENALLGVTNFKTLKGQLEALSPLKKWLYTKDELFTTPYLKTVQEQDYDLVPESTLTVETSANAIYPKVEEELGAGKPNIVKSLYPFPSPHFLKQLENKTETSTLMDSDFSVKNQLVINTTHGLIGNTNKEKVFTKWYTGDYTNIFQDANFTLSGTPISILNTPYFTNALNKDITNSNFKASSYLFLNSLPLVNLHNWFPGTNNYVFASFNQVAAIHKIPYLWVLKLGSVWHRNKNRDVLNDVFKNNDVEELFDGGANNNLTLTINGIQKNIAGLDNNVGFYPKYHGKYYMAITGKNLFTFTGSTLSEYETKVQAALDGNLKVYRSPVNQIDYFTTYVSSGNTNILLPSCGFEHKSEFKSIRKYQNLTTRLYLADKNHYEYEFSGFTHAAYNEYFGTSIKSEYKKTYDLLATFKAEVLDLFEEEFIKFSSDTGDLTMLSVLQALSIIKSNDFVTTQNENCKNLSDKLIDKWFELKLGNPTEVNLKTIDEFLLHTKSAFLPKYDTSQVTSGTTLQLQQIIGEDLDNHYRLFFADYNIQHSEKYFKEFRFLARYYAGLKKINGVSRSGFLSLVQTLRSNYDIKLDMYISAMSQELRKITPTQQKSTNPNSLGFNDDKTVKYELYNSFKVFNDRWTGGNIIPDKTIMKDFLFFDRRNQDVGQKAFVNLYQLQSILDKSNTGKMSIYGLIGMLIDQTGFNFIALPAYVNFYGINEIGNFNRPKYTTTEAASDIFGTFLEVDYVKSSPKYICQYVGLTSSVLDMVGVSDDFKFSSDTFKMSNTANNPYLQTPEEFRNGKYDKSNRIVCFEVNFSDPGQSIFKNINLDQANIKNTSESYKLIESLYKNETGSNAAQVTNELYSIYSQRNYTVEITAMGNLMIQPSMYFYLNNIPMFTGTYLILEVFHSIDGNTIETTFKGVRQSKLSNPEIDSDRMLLTTNKAIYQDLLKKYKDTKQKGS